MKLFQKSILLIIISVSLLFNCKLKENKDDSNVILLSGLLFASRQVKVSTAAELTTESDAIYDNNKFGLVTATTLKTWIDNWQVNKPADITGNLVIIHSGTTSNFIKPANGVLSFDWNNDVFKTGDRFAYRASRNNGIITDPNSLPTGAITDEILQTYGIDPTKDLIVFAARNDSGAGTDASPRGSIYQGLHRALYWLRYWGVDRKNLAILNGAINQNGEFPAGYLTATSADLSTPTKGNFTIKSFSKIDNSVLVQPLENVIAFAKNPTSHNVYGVTDIFIADARHRYAAADPGVGGGASNSSEYSGSIAANTVGPTSGALFAGHIKGAKFTPWPRVIDQTTGKFKTKSEIASLWSDVRTGFDTVNTVGSGYKDGQTILHYCRTNARSMVTGLSAFLILGKPSVFYENSMIEWTALSANHTTPGLRTLPPGHKFATDTEELTERGTNTPGPAYNASSDINQYAGFNINTSATTSRLNIDEDKAYK